MVELFFRPLKPTFELCPEGQLSSLKVGAPPLCEGYMIMVMEGGIVIITYFELVSKCLRFLSEGEMRVLFLAVVMMFACSGSSFADKLPKSAKPLTADEVKKIYSGNSVVWSKTNGFYHSADGLTKGYNGSYYIDGKWEVNDNEMCMMNQGVDSKTKASDGITYTDCNKWYKDAKGRYWDIWSTRYDGTKPSENDYTRDTNKKFKKGNKIEAKYEKLKQ